MTWVVKMLSPMGLVYAVDNDAGHPRAALDRSTARIDSLASARRLAKSVHGKVFRLVPRKLAVEFNARITEVSAEDPDDVYVKLSVNLCDARKAAAMLYEPVRITTKVDRESRHRRYAEARRSA